MSNVVHCKRERYDVYIGRPSIWGNRFTHKPRTRADVVVATRAEAVSRYREWLYQQVADGHITLEALAALKGKTLGCWCAPKQCHGDVLTKAADWAHAQLEDLK